VVQKFREYGRREEFKGKFSKMIVFCFNIDKHKGIQKLYKNMVKAIVSTPRDLLKACQEIVT